MRKGQQYFKLKGQAKLCSKISGNVLGQKVRQNFMSKAYAPPPLALCDIDPRNWNYCDLIRIPLHPLKNSTSIIECPTPPAESLEGPPKTEEEKNISTGFHFFSYYCFFITFHSSLGSRASH